MPGFDLFYEQVSADVGPDMITPQLLANSQTIYSCDPVVGTTVTGSQLRVRRLVQGDIDALYVNSTTAGILGFMPNGVATDASGNITTLAAPVSLTGRNTILAVPSVSYLEEVDQVSGRAMSSIYSVKNWIAGNLWETTAITESLIGTAVGILISTITGQAARYFWSTAATTKIGRIVQVDKNASSPFWNAAATANVQNTTHNPRGIVVVKLYATYDQSETNVAYGD